MIDALREEMLAHNYRISHEFAFETVTPQQRWKDWMRVNDRVVVEAAAVPAEMYLADVKEPTDAELTAFFDKVQGSRGRCPTSTATSEMPSATPGFRIPRKIDVQFIEANYDEFLAKAEAKVTDEEIAKYYEEHKDLFPKMNVGLMEDKDPKKDAPSRMPKPMHLHTKRRRERTDGERRPSLPTAEKEGGGASRKENRIAREEGSTAGRKGRKVRRQIIGREEIFRSAQSSEERLPVDRVCPGRREEGRKGRQSQPRRRATHQPRKPTLPKLSRPHLPRSPLTDNARGSAAGRSQPTPRSAAALQLRPQQRPRSQSSISRSPK